MTVRRHPTRAGWWVIDIYPKGRKGKRERPIEWTEALTRETFIKGRKE